MQCQDDQQAVLHLIWLLNYATWLLYSKQLTALLQQHRDGESVEELEMDYLSEGGQGYPASTQIKHRTIE